MRLSFTWSELKLTNTLNNKTYLNCNLSHTDQDRIADEYLKSFVVSKFNLFTLGLLIQLKSQSTQLTCFELSENNTKCLCIIQKGVPEGNLNT